MNEIKTNSFSSSVNGNSKKLPAIGKGFIYKITVKRKGLQPAKYIGLTTRSTYIRTEEHIKNSTRLGIMGESVFSNPQKSIGYKNVKNSIYAIIRTGMGITRTTENYKKYFSVETLGEFSLFSLAEKERSFIAAENENIHTGSSIENYHHLRYTNLMNRSKGGEMNWKIIPYKERVIAAYVYLKDEVKIKPKNEKQLFIKIHNIAEARNQSSLSDKKKEKIANVLRLYMYTSPSYELAIGDLENIKTRAQMATAFNSFYRETGKGNKAIAGKTPDEFFDFLSKMKNFNALSTDIGIYNAFAGKVNVGYDSLKKVQKDLIDEHTQLFMKEMQNVLDVVLKNSNKKEK